jgi:hypothetical protein
MAIIPPFKASINTEAERTIKDLRAISERKIDSTISHKPQEDSFKKTTDEASPTIDEVLNGSKIQKFNTAESENMLEVLQKLLKAKQVLEAAGIKVGP